MTSPSHDTLQRIHAALEAAREVLNRFTPGAIEAEYKAGHDPVTEADRAVDEVLKQKLLRDGEGWLSEETVDDFTRLDKERVWVVDPLDGTREFVQGIPEFCVSIAMVENGVPVAGGICNPAQPMPAKATRPPASPTIILRNVVIELLLLVASKRLLRKFMDGTSTMENTFADGL